MLDLENDLKNIISPGKEKCEYDNDYTTLISGCKNRGLKKTSLDFYTETHHILPRCMGGTDVEENLVLLTPLEHLVAHILLFRQDETNLKHIHTIECFLSLSDEHRKPLTTIEEFIKLAADLRERLGISVVCYDDDINIFRVYNKIKDVIEDGFEPTTVSRAAEGFYKKGHGYNWSHLDDFMNNYPNEFKLFVDSNEKLDLFRYRRVISTDLNDNIIAVFNRTSLATGLGFSNDGISFCITRPEEKRTTGGYRWYKYIDYLNYYPERLKEFEKFNGSVLNYESKYPNDFKPINVDNRIVCLDRDKKIIKTYNTAQSVNEDGICDNSISPVLMNKRSHSAGYYWQKAEIFLNNNPGFTSEDLDNYLNVKLNQTIIVSEPNGNIVRMYKNAMDTLKDGIHTKYVSQVLLGTRDLYMGFHWTRLVDWKDIDKLEEYYRDHPEDREKYE